MRLIRFLFCHWWNYKQGWVKGNTFRGKIVWYKVRKCSLCGTKEKSVLSGKLWMKGDPFTDWKTIHIEER